MKPRIWRISTTIFLFASISVLAQRGQPENGVRVPYQINGLVRYADNNAPAEHVLVRIEASIGGVAGDTQTDRGGKFTFTNLDAIAYNVTATAPGYVRAQEHVDLNTTTTAFFTLRLVPENRPGGTSTESVSLVDAKVPDPARKEFEKARLTVNDPKKLDETISHLEKAVSLYPNFVEAQLLLGASYMDARRWDRAEGSLQRILKTNPETPAALFALGELYLQTQKYKEAIEPLQHGIRLDDNSYHGHLTIGRVYYALGDYAKAGPEVGRAIQIKPDLAEANLLAGNILFKARQVDKALPFFEQYLKLDPNGKYAAETRGLVAKIKKALGQP